MTEPPLPATDQIENPLRERLSAAARGQVILTGSTIAASFISQVSLARRSGPDGIGEYAATTLFVVVLSTLTTLGAPYALAQQIAALEASRDPAVGLLVRAASSAALALGIGTAAIAALLWLSFASLVGLSQPSPLPLVVVAAFGAVLTHMAAGVLLGELRMKTSTLLFLLQPTAVIACIFVGIDGTTVSPSSLGSIGFIAAGLGSIALGVHARARPALPRRELGLLIRRSVTATAMPYASELTAWLDRAVVGIVAGTTALGWWATATYLIEAILRLPRAIGAFGVPAYAHLTDDPTGVRRVLDSHVRLLVAFALISGSVIIAGAHGFITAIYGEDFVLATTALRLLGLGLPPAVITLALTSGSLSTERGTKRLRFVLASVPLQLVLSVLLTGLFSIAGTALAQLLTWSLVVAILSSRSEEVPPIMKGARLVRTIVLTIGLSLASLLLARALPWPAAAGTAGVIATVACLSLVGGPERRLLRQLLRGRV